MVTTTNKAVKRSVRKKATKKSPALKAAVTNRANITLGQVKTIVNFYEKNNKKVPAFLAKYL